jgi:hypothetical protein
MSRQYSYNELYNMARALTLALTGKELFNADITDAQADEAVSLLRGWLESEETLGDLLSPAAFKALDEFVAQRKKDIAEMTGTPSE